MNLLDRAGFAPLLSSLTVNSFDIGARGSFTPDLLPAARCVAATGFEPDPVEVARLQKMTAESPWKRLTYLPYALGVRAETKKLNLYSKAGCSSLLTARKDTGALFGRSDYYDLEGTADIKLDRLDDVLSREKIELPDHIKVDVQGAEMDVFAGAPRCLENALAVRTEVSFFPLYDGQPLFADIDSHLRGQGFVLMGFPEMHDWRRRTKVKWPRLASGAVPYSRGQVIHADALYMRMPEDLPEETAAQRIRKLRLAVIAACYQHIDHAAAACESPAMRAQVKEAGIADMAACFSHLSQIIARWPAFYRRLKLPV